MIYNKIIIKAIENGFHIRYVDNKKFPNDVSLYIATNVDDVGSIVVDLLGGHVLNPIGSHFDNPIQFTKEKK